MSSESRFTKAPGKISESHLLPPLLSLSNGGTGEFEQSELPLSKLQNLVAESIDTLKFHHSPSEDGEDEGGVHEPTEENEDASSVKRGKMPVRNTDVASDSQQITNTLQSMTVEAGSSSRREEQYGSSLFAAIEEAGALLQKSDKNLAAIVRSALETIFSAAGSTLDRREAKEYLVQYTQLERAIASYKRGVHIAQGGSESTIYHLIQRDEADVTDVFQLSELIVQGKNYQDNGDWDTGKSQHKQLKDELESAISIAHSVRMGTDVEADMITYSEGSLRAALEAVIKAGISDDSALPSEGTKSSGHTSHYTSSGFSMPSGRIDSGWAALETSRERKLRKLMQYDRWSMDLMD